MGFSPILALHIAAGIVGILSGTAAMSFRKGSPRHAQAGQIFVLAMLTMAAAAVYLAVINHEPNNVGGGVLTFYLVGTAWLTARRRDGEPSRFDWVALLLPLAIGVGGWINGIEALHSPTATKYGVPAGMHIGWVGQQLYARIFEVREDEDGEYYHLVTLWKATKQEQQLNEEHS